MKTLRLLSVLLVLFTLTVGYSQKKRIYKAWITLVDESKVKGVLYDVQEDGILLKDDKLLDTVTFLKSTEIDVLKIRKKGNVGKGAWIGAASGALIGAVAGYSQGDDPPGTWWHATAEEKALGSAIGLAIPGTGIGALIGSGRKKYEIGGDIGTYSMHIPELQAYALHQPDPLLAEELATGTLH